MVVGGSVNAEVKVPNPLVSPVELVESNVLRSEVVPGKEERGSPVVCGAMVPVGSAVFCVADVV